MEQWGPIFRQVRDRSIGGDLDVDDLASDQHDPNPQSLHHRSIGYQPRTNVINLAKKENPCCESRTQVRTR